MQSLMLIFKQLENAKKVRCLQCPAIKIFITLFITKLLNLGVHFCRQDLGSPRHILKN